MEYTIEEKGILDLMGRTDFRNLSKGDVISYASKLAELRPEVARDVLAQYPQFVDLMKTALSEYRQEIDKIIENDDASIEHYYTYTEKDQAESSKSRTEYYDFLKQVQADYSKCLDNPNLTPEQMMEMLKEETKLAEMAAAKDKEIREHDEKIEEKVNAKDSEKRAFNWKLAGGASLSFAVDGREVPDPCLVISLTGIHQRQAASRKEFFTERNMIFSIRQSIQIFLNG